MCSTAWRTLWLVLLLGLFSASASADSIPVGVFSFDNLNPTGLAGATFGLDVFNATQPFGGSPIISFLTFSNLSLLVNLSNGTTQSVGLSPVDTFGDFSTGQLFVAGGVISATLTGTFSPLGVTLANGSTATILPTFSTTITNPLGALQNGDFAAINATTVPANAVPEPATIVLLILPIAGLLLFERKRWQRNTG